MGLFKKKAKKKGKEIKKPEVEKLPELPKLPDFPDFNEPEKKKQLSKLPRFPNSSLGQKFSQDTIKEAVTGGKEEDEEVPEADEFVLEDEQMMRRPLSEDIRKPVPVTFREIGRASCRERV